MPKFIIWIQVTICQACSRLLQYFFFAVELFDLHDFSYGDCDRNLEFFTIVDKITERRDIGLEQAASRQPFSLCLSSLRQILFLGIIIHALLCDIMIINVPCSK
jgi:hypothetical protein